MKDAAARREMYLRGCMDCRYFIRSLKKCSRGRQNCIIFTRDIAESRPFCVHCYWWDSQREHCRRGPAGCVYGDEDPDGGHGELQGGDQEIISCDGCPYSTGRPCVGYCIRQVMRDWKKVRSAVKKAGDAVT